MYASPVGPMHNSIFQRQKDNQLFVSGIHVGKGIGKQLLNQLELFCIQNEISRISLRTMKESDALHFYKKCGFSASEKLIFLSKTID
ncbi:Acetyltransferase (GNAT) family protein [Vibrio mangrovi]|uniref:Acetyltransferase (GNAT) family protein n=3 Tax=Vibrio mangrovi TaxID=474394 RepID=A0A1Y6IRV9_9VIBR|nr:Acetyltransferase (GNAT) family protein [Vibrio mangrovi]